jgi:hypothetical protein
MVDVKPPAIGVADFDAETVYGAVVNPVTKAPAEDMTLLTAATVPTLAP